MSDSDETDILLLIPPDFFNIEAAPVSPTPRNDRSFSSRGTLSYASFSCRSTGCGMADSVSNYGAPTTPIDASSRYYSSTPIKRHPEAVGQQKDQYLLNEIDQFLRPADRKPECVRSPENSLIDVNSLSLNEYPSLTASDFHTIGKAAPGVVGGPVPQKPPRNGVSTVGGKLATARGPLLSLSDIWHHNGPIQESSKIQEERLRRQHCERNIHTLQMKLLEYEQKISVAVSVDKEKEGLIISLEQENGRLNNRIREMELKQMETQETLLSENVELKNKKLCLEKELADALAMLRKSEDRQDGLEVKLESLTNANRDASEVHKSQLKDLEIRLLNSRDTERQLRDQLVKMRKSCDQLKDELEAEKKKSNDGTRLRADFCALKTKTDTLGKKFNDVTNDNESLRDQLKQMKEQMATHQDEKKNLLKELDVQRLSLKKYYQSQLEDVVSDKLKEFQKQLATVEEDLKTESKKKERTLAERAIKQIELINQKNDQEIRLLTERYTEQEALYRLQLTNSSQRIYELEEKLSALQNRRADIADKLHTIMETQWQKALEVLTSTQVANASSGSTEMDTKVRPFSRLTNSNQLDKDQLDGVRSLKNVMEREDSMHTPARKSPQNSSLPKELLHNYIELLLEKSPSDLKRLEEVLSSCRKPTHKDARQLHKSLSATTLNQLVKSTAKTTRPWK